MRTASCPASLAGGIVLMTAYCIRRPMGTWPSPITPLDELAFTFVDVETTGLDPAMGDRVCEIALLRVQGGREITRFESLVHPQRPMHPGALAVHGITDAMLVGAPIFATLLPQGHADRPAPGYGRCVHHLAGVAALCGRYASRRASNPSACVVPP